MINPLFVLVMTYTVAFDRVSAASVAWWKHKSSNEKPVHGLTNPLAFAAAKQSMPPLPPSALRVDSADLFQAVKGKPKAVDYFEYSKKSNLYNLRGKNNHHNFHTSFLFGRHVDDSKALGVNSVANEVAANALK